MTWWSEWGPSLERSDEDDGAYICAETEEDTLKNQFSTVAEINPVRI